MTPTSGSAASFLLTEQLGMMADEYGHETGYVDVNSRRELTFEEWDKESDRLARWLLDAGTGKGERVAIFLPQDESVEWIVAYAATHKAGAVAVPTNTRLAPRELQYVLGHAGVVAAFAGESTTRTLVEALPRLRNLVTTASDAPDWALGWQAAGSPGPERVQVPLDGDDIADIMYTSGTTGRPKGVVVRHRNAAMMPNRLPEWTGEGWLHASPLFTFAGISSVYNPMKLGMTGLFLPRFDAKRWMDEVEDRRPTAAFLVPAMAELLVAHPGFAKADLSSLRMCSLGSAPLAPDTMRRLQAKMPDCWVSNNWGMTEAGSAYCVLPPAEAGRRVGSVGKPVPPMEVMVVDEQGDPLGPNEPGELLVRNPGREREYFNDPEATAQAWRDGWLHTGDLARIDEDGYLYIVGRQKDVIIRGGNNVHAGDVEAAIMEFPGVAEVAVAGVHHAVLGEDVAAWIVPAPGQQVDLDELRAFLGTRLSDYKIPRQVHLMDELPRNATGKVVKSSLPGRTGQFPDTGVIE
jgi:acyl-CoA synthetase (AMP-forming)/AMP-acid ligase II